MIGFDGSACLGRPALVEWAAGKTERRERTIRTRRVVAVTALLLLVVGGVAVAAYKAGQSDDGPNRAKAATIARTEPPVATTAPVSSDLYAGTYADGAQGVPHYFLTVVYSQPTSVSGLVGFVFQDGKTSTVFTFTGTLRAGSGTLSTQGGPATISVTYGATSIEFAQCMTYLQYAQSNTACNFTYVPTIPPTTSPSPVIRLTNAAD